MLISDQKKTLSKIARKKVVTKKGFMGGSCSRINLDLGSSCLSVLQKAQSLHVLYFMYRGMTLCNLQIPIDF